jgi:DNA-binding MarR family transcriptional regulator
MTDHVETIGAAINHLQRLLSSRRVFSRLATSAGLSLSQQATQVLLSMSTTPRPIADVAATANMDVGAVSRQLKVLEDEGLAKRAASPSHGRIILVRRTPKGERLGEHVRDVRNRHLVAALSTWTPEERRQLGTLLTRLVSDLQTTPYQRS